MSEERIQRMRAALRLARQGLGATWPNPAVGCVIAREGRVLGRGYTAPGGRPHAEQVALAQVRALWGPEALRGATAWVTLEPCAHHGHTPPCADALAEAGVARVVSTIEDPDPRVSGRGFAALRAAGVTVELGVLAEEAREVAAGFLSRLERGRPWVTLKLAASLDGRIAAAGGESRWITGPAARARVHLMRAEADAVMVGAGTAKADDPMLDVRLPGFDRPGPVRVVVDGALGLSLTSRLVTSVAHQPLWLLHHARADPDRRVALGDVGVVLIEAAGHAGALDLRDAMSALAARGVTRVLCEGGGGLAAGLLRAGLVDEVALFTAGLALGAEGAPSVAPLGLAGLAGAPRFRRHGLEQFGEDVLSWWRPA